MAGQALYRKWRSQTFEEVVGQEHVTLTLRNALREGRLSHAYLFTGPRGTGKTSTARILAKAVNCLADDPVDRPCTQCRICVAIAEGHQLDLIEIDAASNRGIDEIRDLREKIGFRPNETRYKIYIIDEVHMLTKEAFNALLKTLEEPPPHAIFVLATTEPDRVPETIRSRCQRFDFRRIPSSQIVSRLAEILETEGGQAAPEALMAIARRSTGSMRDAISLLDQLLSYGDEVVSLARVEGVLGLVDGSMVSRLVDHIISHDAAEGLRLVNQLVAGGVELGQLVDQVLVYLRALLFMQVVHAPDLLDVSEEVSAAVERQAEMISPAATMAAVREFVQARGGLRDQVPGVPQLPIELAFLRAASFGLEEKVPSDTAVEAKRTAVSAGIQDAPVPLSTRETGASGRAAGHGERSDSGSQAEPPPANMDLLEAAQHNWDRFLAAAGKRGGMKVQAALRSVREIDVAGQTLVLKFTHAFARDLVNQGEHRLQVETLWGELLNRTVQVRCAVAGESVSPASAPPPSASAGSDDGFLRSAQDLGAVVKRLD